MKTIETGAGGQKGFSLMELIIVLGVIAVAGAFIAVFAGGATSGERIRAGNSEIEGVVRAAQTYRRSPAQRGLFTNITIQRLSDRGYNVEPFTSGTNENAFGLTITIAPAAGGADATLTYATDSTADCNQMIDRWTNIAGIKGTPTCATNTLTLTLE